MRRRSVASLREDAGAVLPHADLSQVYAVSSSMQVHDRRQAPPFRCETLLRAKGQLTDGQVEAWARYETTAHSDDEGGGSVAVWTAVVECVASFDLDQIEVTVSEDQLEAFALLVGTPALHPFARAWTQTLTSQTQYPAFTLGLLTPLAELDPEHVIELDDRAEDE